MQEVKKCKQCGEIKVLTHFRTYYNGRKGTYKVCLDCEKINGRYKYLQAKIDKGTAKERDIQEHSKLQELYELLRSQGFDPPRFGSGNSSCMKNVDSMIERLKQEKQSQLEASEKALETLEIDTNHDGDTVLPEELAHWSTVDLAGLEPEYLQDEVYDILKNRYRPQLGLDSVTLLPQYDDTYKTILDAILKRFDEYEEQYYEKDEE